MTKVAYPIFLEFTHHVKDDYWKLLYEDMAFGKFPSGVYIQKNFFCCFSKGKEFSVELLPNNFSVFTQIHSLLSNDLGIRSEKEKLLLKENIIQQAQTVSEKRLIKDVSLTSFIIKKGEQYHLPDHIICKVFSLLIVCFMFKTLLLKDVDFQENNEIQDVRGFTFTDKRVRINKNILELKKPHLFQEHRHEVMSSHWQKYLCNLSLFTIHTDII